MGWYNASWLYRVKITVQAGQVDTDQNNYVVYVDLSDLPAGFHTNVNQTDGRDIRVTSSDGETEIPREVVFYDSSIDGGELHFKGYVDGDTNTDFYIYYGNASAAEPAVTATYGRNNVWTDYYRVYHLQANFTDSSGNLDGTNYSSTDISGKIEKGRDFSGGTSNQRVEYGAVNKTDNFTVQHWINPDTVSEADQRFGGAVTLVTGHSVLSFRLLNAGVQIWDGAWKATGQSLSIDSWQHLSFNFGVASGGSLNLGTQKNGGAVSNITATQTTWGLNRDDFSFAGRYATYGTSLNGQIDEFRVSKNVLSTSRTATDYNNQSSPSTFYSVGTQEVGVNTETKTVQAKASISVSGSTSIIVQSGNDSLTSGETSTTATITEVDTLKAFILVSVAGESADYERHNITAEFTDSTTITFERDESGTEVFFTWQVVETEGNHFEVWTDEISVGSGDTVVNETISTVGDVDQCSIFYQFRGGLGDDSRHSLFMGELTSTTNLRFTRSTSGSAGTIRYWVVKWHEDVTVQNGTISMTTNTASDSITAVDLTQTALFTTHNADTNGLAQVSPVAYLGSTTSVNLYRETSTGSCDVAYSVVEFPDDVNVIANNEGNGGLTLDNGGSSTTLDETISTVDLDATMVVHTNACTGTGTAFCRTRLSSELTSTTNIQFRCDYTGQNRDISYYVVDFASWTLSASATTETKTVTAKARVKYTNVTKTIQAKANIVPDVDTITKTIQAKARIKYENVTKSITAKARIQSTGVTKSVQAKARIDGSSSLSYDAFMNSASSGYYIDSATESVAYKFIAKESLTVNQISVQFGSVVSAPTYRVGLQADSSGDPSGTYLTSGTVTPGTDGWQDITVSDYAITQGTTYHIVISYESGTIGASNRVAMNGFNEFDTRYPYDLTEGGFRYKFSNDSGSSWTDTNQQTRFAINKTFGNPIDGWVQGRVYGTRYRGQRISFDNDTPISALGFWITKAGSPSGDLVCEIQTDDGTTLASGTLGTPAQIEETYFNFYHVVFSQITLSANTYYRVFIKTTGGDASNYYDCLGYTTGESSLQHLSYGGKFSQATVSNDSGSAWTEYPQYDFLFEVSNAKNIQAKARVFFYGAWSDTRSYTVTSPISTETKTVTAKARIKYANQTKSITAKARVKLLAVEKTIQAKSRIKSTGSTKSITAKARIKYVDVAKTITSKARIKYSSITKSVTSKARVKYSDVTKTITSKARVLLNTTKTITAKTRVKYASVTKSITAKTRVKLPTNKTITALARIKNYSTQTVQAKARIVSTGITKSIAAKARIKLVNQTKTTQAKARVKYSSVTKTVTSKARILLNKVKTITSKARIKLSTNKTISARADIRKLNVTKSIQAKARVKYSSVIKTIQAKARTKFVNITKNVTAKARILFVKTKSAQAKARVKLLSSKSIQAKARIASTGATQSIQAKARVKLLDITQSITARTRVKFIDVTKSVTAKARVLFNKTKSIQSKARILLNKDKTIQARARILVTQAKSITSKARVKLLTEKTISSKARIIGGGILKDVQAKARVKLLDITKTISSKARVKLLTEKSIEAKARVKYASVEKDIQSKARLKVLSEQSIQAKARIKATGSIQSIEAKARVKFADNTKSVTSKARVKLIDITKSVQTKSRIKLLTEKVIEAKARILVVASKSVQALARIKTTSVQSISAKARVVSTGVTKSVQALSRVKLITTRTISAKARIKKLRDKTISAKALIKYEATKTIQAKATVDKTVEKSIQAKAAIRLVDQTKTISAKSRIKSSGTTKSISAKAFIAILAPDDITVTHGAGIEDEVDNVVIEGQSKPTFIFVEGISKPTIESLYGSNILSGKIIINQVSGLTAPSIFKVV